MIDNLYIEETKAWLLSRKTLTELSKEFNCSATTIGTRSVKTIYRLVEYFCFTQKNIIYPYNKKYNSYGYWVFNNARKHSDFWLKVIEDYENRDNIKDVQPFNNPINEINYIRHKIQIDTDGLIFSFFIMLPSRLIRLDLISLSSLVNKNDITEEQFEYLQGLQFEVNFLAFEKDENGIFLETFVTGH